MCKFDECGGCSWHLRAPCSHCVDDHDNIDGKEIPALHIKWTGRAVTYPCTGVNFGDIIVVDGFDYLIVNVAWLEEYAPSYSCRIWFANNLCAIPLEKYNNVIIGEARRDARETGQKVDPHAMLALIQHIDANPKVANIVDALVGKQIVDLKTTGGPINFTPKPSDLRTIYPMIQGHKADLLIIDDFFAYNRKDANTRDPSDLWQTNPLRPLHHLDEGRETLPDLPLTRKQRNLFNHAVRVHSYTDSLHNAARQDHSPTDHRASSHLRNQKDNTDD